MSIVSDVLWQHTYLLRCEVVMCCEPSRSEQNQIENTSCFISFEAFIRDREDST